MDMSPAQTMPMHAHAPGTGSFASILLIGLIAFLTVIDLFGTQAILPALTRSYGVSPAAMGLAVNASTFGMAAAGLAVAWFSRRIDRRRGILASLTILAVPTALLAFAPDLATFAALRVVQGLCMASAFTLTLAYFGEHCSADDAAGAFAAYITGNVASNLFGRLIAASVADRLGLGPTFFALAALNLAGAFLVYVWLTEATPRTAQGGRARSELATSLEHLRNPRLRTGFAIGFCILFAFIGTFTFVNFVLVRPPIGLSQMSLGFVYFVFLPSIATTLMAGLAVRLIGARASLWLGLGVAALGLPLLVLANMGAVLAGLALIGIGTFFAQATATGFVSRTATGDRGQASGIYLASYFFGGLVGSFVLGQIFDRFGWAACVAGIGAALAVAALLTTKLRTSTAPAIAKGAESSPAMR
jgi:predicted MFS family arabinose efflux permease